MRINTGAPGVLDMGLIDKVIETEKAPLAALQERRGRVVSEKNEYSSLASMLGELGSAANSLKMPNAFRQLAFHSSHPEILDGVIDGAAEPGSYELEVRGLASVDKHAAFGFKDKDKTPVGFGYLQIEGEGGKASDVVIKPGSTLNDVANAINSAGAGVRAQIVDTGISGEPFRLMVASEKTGEAAKIHIDPDTTYLEFQNTKAARDLDVNFEDLAVKRSGNKLNDLIGGVKMDARKAEPGTKVQVSVAPDIDKTFTNIKAFTDKYNQVSSFLGLQFQVDNSTHKVTGKLNGDGNVRTILRNLQNGLSSPSMRGGSFSSLADIGITTNAKSGQLEVSEQKLKGALGSDYEGVAKLFTVSEDGEGVAARLGHTLDRIKDPVSGAVPNRMAGLDRIIKDQDQQIETQTRRLDERKVSLERQFASASARIDGLNAQSEALSSRFAGDAPAGKGA